MHFLMKALNLKVSIPNGKPGPLRRLLCVTLNTSSHRFNPKREARPSQTLAQEAARFIPQYRCNPKREARPSQTAYDSSGNGYNGTVSIPNGKPGPLRL